MVNNASENASVKERQDRDKRALIEALKEIPIITMACKKVDLDRSTYYRWRQEDKDFLQQSRDAMNYGIEFINDMSESQLVTLIKEKKMPAIALWLKHNHPRYGAKIEIEHSQSLKTLSPEQENTVKKALRLAQPKKAIYHERKTG